MLQLRTFGGLALLDGAGVVGGPAGRPRSLALLALVAAAGELGVSRDKLLACLWPDSDTDSARNCLKQTVFALRRGLAADPFAQVGSTFRLERRLVWVDSLAFDDELAAHRDVEAVFLYEGPYLEGFHLASGGEFEYWAELERARLAARHRAALFRLAQSTEATGVKTDAVVWWQRLTWADPFSSAAAIGLMRCLAASGRRVEALQHARLHEQLLRSELDVSPDPEEQAFVAALRSEGRRRMPNVTGEFAAAF